MKIKLYSDAHVAEAERLFPEKINNQLWLETQWTDEEINACKAMEMEKFQCDPSIANYPGKILNPDSIENVPADIIAVDKVLSGGAEFRKMLSVGCGDGYKELWLAQRHPEVGILCIDNAPYVEKVNLVAKELRVSNIEFQQYDLRKGNIGEFDLVYSMAVIYCIPDEGLPDYFLALHRNLAENGRIIVGTAANISPMYKLVRLIGRDRKDTETMKQTGWMRDWVSIREYIPKDLRLMNIRCVDHGVQVSRVLKSRVPLLAMAIEWFSAKVYPITNSTILFYLEGNK